jgi:hypothetical protein
LVGISQYLFLIKRRKAYVLGEGSSDIGLIGGRGSRCATFILYNDFSIKAIVIVN